MKKKRKCETGHIAPELFILNLCFLFLICNLFLKLRIEN
ncbi:Uncharacterized protein dnm_000380 [Desulfonema magnum]|uniref:Uncharacterized protein n=1 Tax=Desulfonema magnum TaxID=45655 RepID=A0A975BEN6_9BACT|nr:Uncharacterized protein dnm_000380 [Desulfonema magnum]